MKKFLKVYFDSRYDIWVAISQAIGGCIGTMVTYSDGPESTIYGTIAGIFTGTVTIYFFRFFSLKLNIKKSVIRRVFIKKFEQDIQNSFVSNISINEANLRMQNDSKIILDSTPTLSITKSEKDGIQEVSSWLSANNQSDSDFSILQSRKRFEETLNDLVNKVNKATMNEKLIFNSSIVEPGCVWIVEYLKNLGVELHHDFNDINGIEQARTLANDIDISASFIPYSTILLSKNRKKIIKKFNCIMPITFEEQVIIVDRDSNGNFQLDNINCPERGSGHYELMVSKNDTIYKDLNPNIIDLNRFTNKLIANNSIILYQPAADLFLESKRNKDSAMWGFVKNRPFPIDIIFIAKYDSFNGSIEHLKKLIHLILYKYKSDSIALSKQINKFYKKNAFRRKFIVANNHFFNQIVDSN